MIETLKLRFNQNKHRHPNVSFESIEDILLTNSSLLDVVKNMEKYGGDPDVYCYNSDLYFVDFSKETPKERVSVCYDEEARLGRKKFPPAASAEALAKEIGITLLDQDFYHSIQKVEALDLKTSSWLLTPKPIRDLGGALFGDKRYNTTFIYHNGADSYYGVRGFRGYILIK